MLLLTFLSDVLLFCLGVVLLARFVWICLEYFYRKPSEQKRIFDIMQILVFYNGKKLKHFNNEDQKLIFAYLQKEVGQLKPLLLTNDAGDAFIELSEYGKVLFPKLDQEYNKIWD